MQSLFNYCQVFGWELLETGFSCMGWWGGGALSSSHTYRPLPVSVTGFKSIDRVLGALRIYLGLVVVTEVRFVVQWGAGSLPSAGWVGSAHFVLLLVRPVITLIVDISCLRNRQPPPPPPTNTPRVPPPTASVTLWSADSRVKYDVNRQTSL